QPIRELNPDAPDWLCDLVAKLHAKDPSARPASAREAADLLGSRLALLQQPPLAPLTPDERILSVKRTTRMPKVPHNRRLVAVIFLVALLAAIAALTLWLVARRGGGAGSGEEGVAPRPRGGPVTSLNFRREDIPPMMLALAGGGDPARAPPELAAVLGDGRFLFPRLGQTAWLQQSPDGQVLAVPLDEDVMLFEVPSGKYLRDLKGPGGRGFNVTFSSDGQLLGATTRFEGAGGLVRVWDFHVDRVLFTNPLPGPTISCAAAFSPDGKRLYTEGDGRVHGWDARSGQKLQTLEVLP